MLCYAWNTLSKSDEVITGCEKFDNVHNLLTRVLISGVEKLIKRGFHREYIEEHDELCALRGRINVSQSINNQSIQRKKLVCEFDEFSSNVPFNSIIKTTMRLLLKNPYVDQKLKFNLMRLLQYFNVISEIKLSGRLFLNLRYSKNNKNYKMLINVCELIYDGLITNQSGNSIHFCDFIKDHKMAKLYEQFVLNFYKMHLPKERYKVYAPKFEWDLDQPIMESSKLILPEMRTDIVIEDRLTDRQLIIDTKYYTEALISGNYNTVKKARVAHLYQVYAYLCNSRFSGTISGMLLYPTVECELNEYFPISQKPIEIRTVNLNEDWDSIRDRLMSLIK